ncbi:secA translation cis-regulator SecM [Gallibacterium anatis]|uniref:secA translation cis-regulator SecM n=1 Tax=Gallibacterium anatis TaxID=750 RepID=UPI003004A919
MNYLFSLKIGKKTAWPRLILSLLTLLFLPIHSEQPNQVIPLQPEANQSVIGIESQQLNLQFVALKKQLQQSEVVRQKSRMQPIQYSLVQSRPQQLNRYQILIRAGPKSIV